MSVTTIRGYEIFHCFHYLLYLVWRFLTVLCRVQKENLYSCKIAALTRNIITQREAATQCSYTTEL